MSLNISRSFIFKVIATRPRLQVFTAPMKNQRRSTFFLIVLTLFLTLTTTSYTECFAKPKLDKYKKCRLKCLEKDDKCTHKANKKRPVVKKNIKCLSDKNLCLEKCSDHVE